MKGNLAIGDYPLPKAVWIAIASISASLLIASVLYTPLLALLQHYWFFYPIGLIGAIVANSTGAGGGVVFVPAFSAVGLDMESTVATSIAIQCFGMTSGMITWCMLLDRTRVQGRHSNSSHSLLSLSRREILMFSTLSIAGAWIGELLKQTINVNIREVFDLFSIFLGLSILYVAISRRNNGEAYAFRSSMDNLQALAVVFVGGMITSVISVGVGELITFFLIIKGRDILQSVAIAVTVSALTVLSLLVLKIIEQSVYWNIVLLAAPAAILGGYMAKRVAVYLGPLRLKIFIGVWLIFSGAVNQIGLVT